MKKTIKIPKDFFKGFKFKVSIPTFKCPVCGEKVLDTPSNRMRLIKL